MEKKAEYQISSSVNEGILEIILMGEVLQSTVENLQNEIFAVIDANGVENVLVDVRSFEGHLGFGDAYNRVRKYPPSFIRLKVALVVIRDNADFQSFFMTTAYNAGLRFKWFTDLDAAKDWLKSNQG